MDKEYSRKISSAILLSVLAILSFFILRPILLAMITGVVLAFIFSPLYLRILKKVKSKNISAILVCLIIFAGLFGILWFTLPVLLRQSIEIYTWVQTIDLVSSLQSVFPSLFGIDGAFSQIAPTIRSFFTTITRNIVNYFYDFLLQIPKMSIQFVISFFTFFFVLKDGDKLVEYIQSMLPFPKKIEEKLFKSSKDITFSILYGQIILGIFQGLLLGIGFYIFGIENALFLALLAALAGIFPIIGTTLVWVPVVLFAFFNGQLLPAFGILFFGLLTSFVETAFKPVFVSKKTNVHSGVILLGMIGGIYFFGMFGVILGPLILSYLLIVLEIFRDKRTPGYFIQSPEEEDKIKIKWGFNKKE